MPTVQIYRQMGVVSNPVIGRLITELHRVLPNALDTEVEQLIILSPEHLPAGLHGLQVFVDVLVKDKPERSANLKERAEEAGKLIRQAIGYNQLPEGTLGLRFALAPIAFKKF